MCTAFQILVSYAQIAVCDNALRRPFNSWRAGHVKQGFAWRPGSVSFRTLLEAGQAEVEVALVKCPVLRPDAIRAIVVPFVLNSRLGIEVASISDGHEAALPEGAYNLQFETGLKGDIMWIRLSFSRQDSAEPRILRADAGLEPGPHLLMDAEPA